MVLVHGFARLLSEPAEETETPAPLKGVNMNHLIIQDAKGNVGIDHAANLFNKIKGTAINQSYSHNTEMTFRQFVEKLQWDRDVFAEKVINSCNIRG